MKKKETLINLVIYYLQTRTPSFKEALMLAKEDLMLAKEFMRG